MGSVQSGMPEHTHQTCTEVRLPALTLENPQLWSCESPQLYNAEVVVTADGMVVDSLTEQLGIASLPDQAESEKYFKSDTEKFPDNMEEVVYGICNQVLSEATVPVDRLSQDEKIAIVEKLDGKGVFLFKGAVALVAGRLQTSEATIYRYLSKINRAGGKNGLQ